MPDFRGFACDQCGACCRSLIIEADYVDAMREPRLYEIAADIDHAKFRAGQQCIMLWSAETHACSFLAPASDQPGQHLCGIYATRPQCCVAVEAGDAKCQQAREFRKLPILCDRDGNPPSREVLDASAEEYELDWTPYYEAGEVEEGGGA